MPVFQYKAISNIGKDIKGKYEAKDKSEVIKMLRENQFHPVNIREEIKGNEINLDFLIRVKLKDIAVFCRQFYTMLHAGVTIMNCLQILSEETENKKLKHVAASLYESVQKGMTFGEALKKHRDVFPELLINMVDAGEASGNLDVIMERMSVHFEKENRINNKVKGAMVYPTVLSIVSVLVVTFLITFILPTFVSMFDGSGVALPLPTRILLGLSSAAKKYWYLILIVLGIIAYIAKKVLKTDSSRLLIDELKLKLPIIKNTTVKVVTVRFTRTLSTLMSSGMPLIQALEIVAKVTGNRVAEKGILRAIEDIKKGAGMADPIRKVRVFPAMVCSMISIGEESGTLDEILEKTANYFDEEVETAITKLTTMLEPLMIVVMAVVIGAIVIAMVLPMFEMMNTIKT